MKNLGKLCVVIMLALSCGHDDKESKSSDSASKLQGTWASDCMDSGDGTAYKDASEFKDNMATNYHIVYEDSKCALSGVKTTTTLSFTTSSPNLIDYVVQKITIKAVDTTYVNQLNADKAFGLQWKLNEEQDVSGKAYDKNSPKYPSKNSKIYSIFKITDEGLMTGDRDQKDGSTQDKRPTVYKTEIFHRQ